MITVTRSLPFDYGHRILGHDGKCRWLHGHRGVAEITIGVDGLNGLGMVVDFGVIKDVIGSWIDTNWDHNLLLNPADPMARILTAKRVVSYVPAVAAGILKPSPPVDLDERRPYIFPSGMNPTAENMARELFSVAKTLLPDHFQVLRMRIFETPSCWADCTTDGQPDTIERNKS